MVTLPIQIEDEILGDPSASPGPGTAPDDAQSSLKVQPEEALAPAEPTVEVMIVNTISELQVALAQSEEHIEIRKHLVVYDETCRSPRNCVHGFPRQPAEQTDANGYRYVPSDFTVNGQTYVSPWTRSIRGNCTDVFEVTEDASVSNMQQRGTQCLLLFPKMEPSHNHTAIIDVLSEPPITADIFPLWLDNLYVASQEFEPNAGHEAFLWASRDIWMTNMTMHADSLPHKTADNPPRLLLRGETEAYNSTGGTTVGAVWADDHVLAEDSNFIGFSPPPGQSAVTIVRMDSMLHSCHFTGSYTAVHAENVSWSGPGQSSCCIWPYYTYSGDLSSTGFFSEGPPQQVGGESQGYTHPADELPNTFFTSWFTSKTDFLRTQVRSAKPVQVSAKYSEQLAALSTNRGYTPLPAVESTGVQTQIREIDSRQTLGVALLASLICAIVLLAVTVLMAALIWRRHRVRTDLKSSDSNKQDMRELLAERDDAASGSVMTLIQPSFDTSARLAPKDASGQLCKLEDMGSSMYLENSAMESNNPQLDSPDAKAAAFSGDLLNSLTVTTTNRPSMPHDHDCLMKRRAFLEYQLDSMRDTQILDSLKLLPGLDKRLCGGQAVVQIAEDSFTREQFAVKFFLSKTAFSQEAKLYKDPEQPLGRFLPECRMIMDPTTGIGCTDKRGHALPPFIVMEKGESLDRWAARSEDGLDFVTGLQILTHVAERLKCLHSAGYVHRDIKPGNIMWLPRKNRWTLIDFGCATKTGTFAFSGFSVFYAPPELLAVVIAGQGCVQAAEALDAWSVGILALELFSGKPVWSYKTCSRHQVVAQIVWGPAPWEDPATAPRLLRKLGHFRSAILRLLDRDPLARPSMADFQRECDTVLRDPHTLRSNGEQSVASGTPPGTPRPTAPNTSGRSTPRYYGVELCSRSRGSGIDIMPAGLDREERSARIYC